MVFLGGYAPGFWGGGCFPLGGRQKICPAAGRADCIRQFSLSGGMSLQKINKKLISLPCLLPFLRFEGIMAF
jgi:hypothetical protein